MTRRGVLAGLAVGVLMANKSAATASAGARVPGVYLGAAADGRRRLPAYEAWLGRPVSGVVDFLAFGDWNEVTYSSNSAISRWSGLGRRLTLTIPMLTRRGGSTLALGASGAYDRYFQNMATRLVQTQQSKAIIRIGHEFNGAWTLWCANSDLDVWINYWRRIASVFRKTPGAMFEIEWSPNLGVSSIDPGRAWPGDDLVDIIGGSFYNDCRGSCSVTGLERWKRQVDMPTGLGWHREFAASKRKPVSFAEWGTGIRLNGGGGGGGGDDPVFIERFNDWLSQQDLRYHNYFDYNASDFHAKLSDNQFPKAAAAFKAAFSSRRL